MSKNLIDELVSASPNRRSFLRKIAAASVALGAGGCTTGTMTSSSNPFKSSSQSQAITAVQAQSISEADVLNFALNLEYLEAEFYTVATMGKTIDQLGIGINGVANSPNPPSGGTTTGGNQVTFSNNLVFSPQIANEIGSDERAHVVLLRSALGAAAVAKPNINLNALGFGFGSQDDFLKLARIFEDIGVSAYGGAAGLLTTPAYITTAARILAAEAEHVAAVRVQVARLNIATTPLDGADLIPPPSGPQTQYLSINTANGLTATRTPGQVLYLAYGNVAGVTSGGFYPNGVNGTLNTSSSPATSANLS